MRELPPITRAFLVGVRRRMIFIRIAESLAIALAAASGAGVVFLLLIWGRAESAGNLIPAILILGAICGLIWGIARRPTELEAAIEADRQLNLQDLLGTVLLIGRSKSNPQWREAVFAMAENRCEQLRPTELVIRRLGLRAWGGAGLSTALLLTLGLLTAHPASSQASGGTAQFAQAGDLLPAIQPAISNPIISSSSEAISRPPGPGGQDEPSNRDADHPDAGDSGDAAKSLPEHSSLTGDQGGAGTGMAITQLKDRASPADQADSSAADSSANGQTAGGNGEIDPQPAKNGQTSGGNVRTSGDSQSAADSNSSAKNPQSKTDAKSQSDNHPIPDWANDLVKDYFQRD
jgi:hypothetical protein